MLLTPSTNPGRLEALGLPLNGKNQEDPQFPGDKRKERGPDC